MTAVIAGERHVDGQDRQLVLLEGVGDAVLATKALDEVRREHWNELRRGGDPSAAKQFKHSRWALLKNPDDLTETQADTLAALHATGGKVPRAWAMKEMVRAIFAPGLTIDAIDELIDRLLSRLSRSRLKPFVHGRGTRLITKAAGPPPAPQRAPGASDPARHRSARRPGASTASSSATFVSAPDGGGHERQRGP